jgi:hypothetical protein
MESIDPENLKAVHKEFNKPAEYRTILDRLAERGVYAITSFIFGMDGDTPGVALRTEEQIGAWPPGLPVYGLLTPYPATPLYDRLAREGRLTRPTHWLDFLPFQMAFTPAQISIEQAEAEVRQAWTGSYSARAIATAIRKIRHRPYDERMILFCARLAFRGIYFPQMSARSWLLLVFRNSPTLVRLVSEGIWSHWRKPARPGNMRSDPAAGTTQPDPAPAEATASRHAAPVK